MKTLLLLLAMTALAARASTQVSPADAAGPAAPVPRPNPTLLISANSSGAPGNGYSTVGAVSTDGRFVVFASTADDLVAGDTNGASDVFVADTRSGLLTRVSTGPGDVQADAESACARGCISADGRLVLFQSAATNLVTGDTNGKRDVFLRDVHGASVRVSLDAEGAQLQADSYPGGLSRDGAVAAFTSTVDGIVVDDRNGTEDVFVRDISAETTERVSVSTSGTGGNGISQAPSVSADGRYVAFASWASNLVPDDSNDTGDVFVRDRLTAVTVRVSLSSSGAQAAGASHSPFITPDGRYVAFVSSAENLVAVDTNGASDVFVKELASGAIALVSRASSGDQGTADSWSPSLSDDGRYVGFSSAADNFLPSDTNLCSDGFVRDRLAGRTWIATTNGARALGNDASDAALISGNGRYALFQSHASNFVAGDVNLASDVFLRRNRP